MTESGISDRLQRSLATQNLTAHDAYLLTNDPIVYNIATVLTLAIREYGIPKIAAAFRAALILSAREENERY
jgi:hypothetical protein